MNKAKYIGKYYGQGFDRNSIYLEYEYRGMLYTIREDRGKGNEPLEWQHRSEQTAIDRIIDGKQATGEDAEVGIDIFMNYVNQ